MVQVIWTERAIRELEAIHDYIAAFRPLAAQRMALRLRSAAEALADAPSLGRSIGHGRRELTTISPSAIA